MTARHGYVDLQVNGYAGVDFNGDGEHALTPESLQSLCSALDRDGVTHILATFITDSVDVMAQRITRLVRLRETDPLATELIRGIHIEGPFLNETPGYRGAHPADAIQPASVQVMDRLLDAAAGLTRVVTLAPERDPGLRVTNMLSERRIVVSAGHCDPTLDELDAALDVGLSMFTHLGNGCPMQMHRHDNVIQRVLARADRLWIGFIADGVHVPFHALGNYLRLAGERAIVVTDAMAAAGRGPGRHRIARWEVDVDENLAAWSPDRSHLVGSAMSMPQAEANLRNCLQLDEATCRELLVNRPARAAQLEPDRRTSDIA